MGTVPPGEGALQKLSSATRLLAEVRNATDAKRLMDLAASAKYYAQKARLGQEAIDHAHAVRVDAERILGEYLKGAPNSYRAGPGRGQKGGSTREPPFKSNTLNELGLTKKLSAEAQLLHTIAEQAPEEYEAIRAGKKTVTAVRRKIKTAAVKEAAKLPSGKYRVIYADPPWKYGDQLTENYGPARFHYPAMSITELCGLPVLDLCEEDAVLFLWVTSPLLEDAFPVIKAWGFEYKTSFVWDKVKHNMGHYNSVRHEFLLVCTRGRCTPDDTKLFDSVQAIERTTHSTKPAQFRTIIETLYTHGKRLELFARAEAAGWDTWGNQV